MIGDLASFLAMEGEFDLVLTDPVDAAVADYRRLAELAGAKLRPGGYCLAYAGLYGLPAVVNAMREHLAYCWTYCSRAPQPMHSQAAPGNDANWRAVLAFAKGVPAHAMSFQDSRQPSESLSPQARHTPAEIRHIIESLTRPGDLIVDPLGRSSAIRDAAESLGRRWLGLGEPLPRRANPSRLQVA